VGTVIGITGKLLVGDENDRGWSLLSPATCLTKICIVDAASGETEREIGDEQRILRICKVGEIGEKDERGR